MQSREAVDWAYITSNYQRERTSLMLPIICKLVTSTVDHILDSFLSSLPLQLRILPSTACFGCLYHPARRKVDFAIQ